MRYHFCCIFLCVLSNPLAAATPEIPWMPYEKALELSRTSQIFTFVDVYADWCTPCKIMDRTTYRNPTVVNLLSKHFAPVKLNAESEEIISCNNWPRPVYSCVTENWKLRGVPSIVLIGPSGNYILSVTQILDSTQMQMLLRDFLDNRNLLLESDRSSHSAGR